MKDSTVIIPKSWLSRLLTKDDLEVLGLIDDRSDFEKHPGDNLLIQITSHLLTKMEDLEDVLITKGQLKAFLELQSEKELRAKYLKDYKFAPVTFRVFGQMVGFDY